MPRMRLTPWIMVALVVLGLILANGWFTNATRDELTYTEYRDKVTAGAIVGTVTVSESSISGTYRDEDGQEVPFSTDLATNFQTQDEVDFLTAEGVDVQMSTPSPWISLLLSILPLVLLMGLLYWFLFRRMAGGGAGSPLSMGRNKIKIYDR
jgi:cell division protease FtsH